MICYKDKTFCSSDVEKHTCGRELSEKEKNHAEEIGIPIAYSEFCNKEVLNKNIEEKMISPRNPQQ